MNPKYAYHNMKDFHLKAPLGMGFYIDGYQSNVNSWISQGISDGGTPPSTSILNALSQFMTSLDGYGLLTRMKTGYIMHTGSKHFAKLNIKDVATFKLTEINTVTFGEGLGCKSDGTSYFNQPFKSDQFVGIESNLTIAQDMTESNTTALDQSSHGMKTNATTLFCQLRPRRVTGTNGVAQNYDAANGFTSANHKALFIHTNNGTNNLVWREGVLDSFAAIPVAPLTSNNRFILARNNAGTAEEFYTASSVALDFLFDVFNATDAANFKTARDAYKTATGLP